MLLEGTQGTALSLYHGGSRYRDAVLADQIIEAVEARLRLQHRHGSTVYRREWSIGVGQSRVDIAAISGRIAGYEIKSGRDNFSRLPSQVRLYSSVLDRATLVVEGEAAAARAEHVTPAWWGIWRAREIPQGVAIHVVRRSASNPSPDAMAVAQLLWRDEALAVLDRRGLSAGLRRATRWRLWEALVGQLPLTILQREARDAIRARPGW